MNSILLPKRNIFLLYVCICIFSEPGKHAHNHKHTKYKKNLQHLTANKSLNLKKLLDNSTTNKSKFSTKSKFLRSDKKRKTKCLCRDSLID